ncbi:Protein kinase-like domain [Pseudocohnilembus persalinus]|uniref:Protein kinase-like domain n=1 Tax=Pseudocohnilembus persalinus TaxID=266149 RepID=A0A0V0R3P1_PSEPJ|nr:Protein kinase-like domain [Pseudocohnilembus persalinus]|eukprot:KRX09106.1 Protein kinase-like domain [Pseudocohnilembus persalinus]
MEIQQNITTPDRIKKMSISQTEYQNLFVHQKKSENGEQIQFLQSEKNKVIICIYKPSNIKNEQRQEQLSINNLKENDQVIVKQIYLQLGTKDKKRPARDVTNLRRAQERQIGVIEHPSVVKAYGIYDLQNENNQFIVMEKGDYNLKNLLDSNEQLTFMEQIRFITSILSGFACLLSHNLYHLDYKPENFIIFNSKNEGQKQIKLTDFGSSIWIQSGKTSEQYVVTGSQEFRAPEIKPFQQYCRINTPYNAEKCDVYSLGKVFLMIIGQKYSLEDLEIPQEYISLGLIDLINGMLEIDPDKRYNFYNVNSLWMQILQKIESKFINAQQVKLALLFLKNLGKAIGYNIGVN